MTRAGLLVTVLAAALSPALAEQTAPAWEVYFSPHGGAEEAVVKTLKMARSSIYVQAYSFTDPAIAKALVDAQSRGVKVEVILDKSNRTAHYSALTFLTNAGIPTSIDAVHEIAHNKVMVVDGDTVITGSYNFTRAAERGNAENLLVVRDRELAARYMANWRRHRAHAQ